MAIRKMRKHMKVGIWVITIAFFLSMALVGASRLFNGSKEVNVAFKVDGRVVTALDIDKTIQVANNDKGAPGFDELKKVQAIYSELTRAAMLNLADELKIKVSRSEVNDTFNNQMDQARAYYKSTGVTDVEGTLNRMLAGRGYRSQADYKVDLEKNMILRATEEKLSQDITVDEDKLKALYASQKEMIRVSYEEFKKNIEPRMLNIEKQVAIEKAVNEEIAKAEITDVADRYKDALPKVVLNIDGYEFKNIEMGEVMYRANQLQGDKERAIELVEKGFENSVKLAKAAKSKGVEVDKNLTINTQGEELFTGLKDALKKDINPSEEEIKAYFEKNRSIYNQEAKVTYKKGIYTDTFDKEAYTRASEILKEVTPENFAEIAKEKSDGPSGPTGGKLGEVTKGQMVPEFEKAIFDEEKVKESGIYPEVVKSQFGYHIIYIEKRDGEKVTASHILVAPKETDELKKKAMEEANEIASKLNDGTLKEEGLKDIKGLTPLTEVKDQVVVEGDKPLETIFNTEDEKAGVVVVSGPQKEEITIYIKESALPFKGAIYEDVKEDVIKDYKEEMANKEAIKLIDEQKIGNIKREYGNLFGQEKEVVEEPVSEEATDKKEKEVVEEETK